MKQIFKESIYFNELSNEVFLMKDLKHTGIPQIYDIEEDNESLCVIEQYIDGESLHSICSRKDLKETDILKFMIQICEIINYLHTLKRPVLYLDLKPENIVISKDIACLVDFGSAIYADASDKCLIFGTKGYAAPEQYHRNQAVDEKADIYAIGRLLYYMVYSRSGCQNHKKGKTSLNVSKDIKNIISRCVRQYSWMRYSKVEEVKRNIEKIYNKKQINNNTQKSIIAVAGSQNRIGTTHLALMLCQRFLRLSNKVLYLECNPTGFLREYLYYSGAILKPGINKLNKLNVGIKNDDIPFISISECDISEYDYIVLDYGILSEMNIDEFIKLDNKVVILGGKEWEISKSKKLIDLCTEKQDICYVLNFLEAGRFFKTSGMLLKNRCLRMPYVPEPLKGNKEEAVTIFIDDILQYHNILAL